MAALVSIIAIDSYESTNLSTALEQCLKPLGGISPFIATEGQTLLKPNLLRASDVNQAITTHPHVVQAVGQAVRQAGGDPLVADSPGAGYAFTDKDLARVYRACQYEGIGLPLNDNTEVDVITHRDGVLVKRFETMRVVKEAKAIINVAKLKTHTLTCMTAAVKNMFGTIPGRRKIDYHAKLKNDRQFGQMLLDLVDCIAPRLSIVDAIVGMEGNGPNMGKAVPIGFIAASTDPILLDFVIASLVGIPWERVPYLAIAIEQNRIPSSLDDITIHADKALTHYQRHIELPTTMRYAGMQWLSHHLQDVLRAVLGPIMTVQPTVIANRCIACGVCKNTCPVGAISWHQSKTCTHAMINHATCIRCYCCHEQCAYDAIELKKGWMRKLLTI